MTFIRTLGFEVYSDDLSKIELTGPGRVLATISPNSYGISTKDEVFRESLKKADYLVLDGVYFALASILINGKNIRRNQGPDVFRHFMERMNRSGGKVFFMGSTENVLSKIKTRANLEYPNVTIESHSPPFKPEFSSRDNLIIAEKINAFRPDIVFVGMTCPKQEKWSFTMRDQLQTKLICSIGAVFDWYAGNMKEISPIWWKLRLAWLKRTIDRPDILKRYPNIFIFFWHLLLAMAGIKKYHE